MEPYESVFVVFRKPISKSFHTDIEANFPKPVIVNELESNWNVQFDCSQRGPRNSVQFDKLIDWTNSENDSIKYYSGTAIYSTKFNYNSKSTSEHTLINLGKITAMAKVYLNGKYVGGLWTSPYTLDISSFVQNGTNELKIEVVNTWMNRLIGDSKLPESERKTWCPVNSYKPDSQLQSSGLLGPVTISTVKY